MKQPWNRQLAPALALVAGMFVACSDPVGLGPTSDVEIRVRITGGIAGVDYTIRVDGAAGEVVGESCVNGCDFLSGEVLMGVTDARIRDWAQRLLEGGIVAEDGRDYGTECCDRFHSVLEYADGDEESTVQGTTDLMPPVFQDVVNELSQLGYEQLPVVVDFTVDPTTLPDDPLALLEVRHNGSVLEFDVEYGGGCEAHVLELIAVGGWMESFPVQVRLVLTHDDRDDPCDALVRDTVRFDLVPLEEAYADAYPGEPVGERTVVIHLDWPGGSGPNVTHRF